MKNKKNSFVKKSISLLLVLFFILSSADQHASINAKSGNLKSKDTELYEYTVNADTQGTYGYTMLASEDHGANMQRLYVSIDQAVSKYIDGGGNIPTDEPYSSDSGSVFFEIPSASFSGKDFSLSLEEMVSVYFTYRSDHPEMFFLPASYLFSEESATIYLVTSQELVLQSERVKYNDLAKKKLKDFKASISSNDTEYDIALKAHDLLMKENFYRYDSGNIPSTKSSAHSIIGWLDSSGIVCEGYAKAYQYLLSNCGVECLYVTGASNNQAHAWNLVRYNSEWFWVDTTFNDQENLPNGFYHYYFGLPNSTFLQSHTPNTQILGSSYQVKLPNVSESYDLFYYQRAEAFISGSNIGELMNTLAKNAKREFDQSSYTVALFAENESIKSKVTSELNRSSVVNQMLKDNALDRRCSATYSVLSVSSSSSTDGGSVIYVKFNYHACDVDRNSFVEEHDANIVLDALCNNIPTPQYADTDQNGRITIYDAILILQILK